MIEVLLADSDELRSRAFDIRRKVFVVEQEVPTGEEFDEFESVSRHFVALNEHGEAVGAARWRRTEKGIKLERFAVDQSQRGKGVGSALIAKVLEDVKNVAGNGQYLYMHAQLTAVPLYEKFGFKTKGDQFLECDILHYYMFRQG